MCCMLIVEDEKEVLRRWVPPLSCMRQLARSCCAFPFRLGPGQFKFNLPRASASALSFVFPSVSSSGPFHSFRPSAVLSSSSAGAATAFKLTAAGPGDPLRVTPSTLALLGQGPSSGGGRSRLKLDPNAPAPGDPSRPNDPLPKGPGQPEAAASVLKPRLLESRLTQLRLNLRGGFRISLGPSSGESELSGRCSAGEFGSNGTLSPCDADLGVAEGGCLRVRLSAEVSGESGAGSGENCPGLVRAVPKEAAAA
eukprot:3188979-Rhodomonas_salina.1